MNYADIFKFFGFFNAYSYFFALAFDLFPVSVRIMRRNAVINQNLFWLWRYWINKWFEFSSTNFQCRTKSGKETVSGFSKIFFWLSFFSANSPLEKIFKQGGGWTCTAKSNRPLLEKFYDLLYNYIKMILKWESRLSKWKYLRISNFY